MITCDVCGEAIRGEPVIVEIDGAVLALCQNCAKRYSGVKGVKVIKGPTPITPQRQTIVRHETRRGVVFRLNKPQQNRNLDRYEIVENYAELIKEARTSLGMTRDALARLIGVKESIIKRIEDGQLVPDIELARKLEKALGITLVKEAEFEGLELKRGVSKELTLGDIVTIREKRE